VYGKEHTQGEFRCNPPTADQFHQNGIEPVTIPVKPEHHLVLLRVSGTSEQGATLAGRKFLYCRRSVSENLWILTQPLLPSYHLFSNMHDNRMNIGDFQGLACFNSFNYSA